MSNDKISSKENEYLDLTDEELIEIIRKDNDEVALTVLIKRYREVVNIRVSKYYMNGAEQDDLVQEGLIGLYRSIQDYDPTKNAAFRSFANLCIDRQLITAIKGASRQKHIPLNQSLSLNNPIFNDSSGESDAQLIDIIDSEQAEDPLDMIARNESYENVKHQISISCSKFEKQVLKLYLEGQSYAQIAEELDSNVKAIDNAIQRIRKKTSKNLDIENK